MKGIGRDNQGFYILDGKPMRNCHFYPSVNKFTSTVQQVLDSSILWNRKMGHAPIVVIKRHDELKTLKFEDHVCTLCPLGKHTKATISTL